MGADHRAPGRQVMDRKTPRGYIIGMDITVRISDDLVERLGSVSDLERRALEALALEEYKAGHLTRPELRRLLGFGTRAALDEFLTSHGVFGT